MYTLFVYEVFLILESLALNRKGGHNDKKRVCINFNSMVPQCRVLQLRIDNFLFQFHLKSRFLFYPTTTTCLVFYFILKER